MRKIERESKTKREEILLGKIKKGVQEGLSGDEVLNLLTLSQYDFLIERGHDLDSLVLTPEQKKATNEIKNVKRITGSSYNKKYPIQKRELYTSIKNFLCDYGCVVIDREKENYRNLTFSLDETIYEIVLSQPRRKKDS